MELNSLLSSHLSNLNIELNLFQENLINSFNQNLKNALIIAPTGIGKTLGASILLLNDWIESEKLILGKKSKNSPLAIWISPLKALSRNLKEQLQRYWDPFWENEIISSSVSRAITDRTGDTSQKDRKAIITNPPFILCTTPESLFSMVVQKTTRPYIKRVKYVIVDELHSLAESKRGVLLTLTLELLERISNHKNIIRIALSATVGNIDWIAKYLVGPKREIVIVREEKFEKTPELDIIIESTKKSNLLPNTGYAGGWLSKRIALEVSMNRTILIFTKTRSSAERMAFGIKQHVSEELKLRIGVHHSALSQEERFLTENGLKHGYFKAVCCTASLELGIDIGHIDEVILLGSPSATNSALQRIGRARHKPDEISKAKLFTVNFFDLLVSIGLKRLVINKELSPVHPIVNPLEVLAQFIFGMALQKPFTLEELRNILSNTLLFHTLTEEELSNVLIYCMQGGNSLGAYEEYKRMELVNGTYEIKSSQFKRLFYQNIGTIVEEDMLPVFSERGRKLGVLEENLAMRLAINDIFSIGGKTYKLTGYRNGHLVVKPDKGQPNIPRWGKKRISLSQEVFESLVKTFTEISTNNGIINKEDWIDSTISKNILTVYKLQKKVAPWPTKDKLQIEYYNLKNIPKRIRSIEGIKVTHPYLVILYTFAGYKQNQTLARLIAHRFQKYGIHQVRIHADEIAFGLFSYKEIPINDEIWLDCLNYKSSETDLNVVLENSNALRIAFRETAVVGQMVLRTYYKTRKTGKQLRLSHDLLFDVLQKYEPQHPLLEAARQQVKNQFLHIPSTLNWLQEFEKKKELLILDSINGLPILSLPVIAHGWIDWSVPENPEEILLDLQNKILGTLD